MSNVIQFLDTLGSNPALSRLPAADYAASVTMLDIRETERQALLNRDRYALSGLLGGRENMVCAVWLPDEQPLRKDDDQREEDQPSAPPESE